MIDEKSLDEARAWIGRSQSLEGVVTPFAASCMAATLNWDNYEFKNGDEVPLFGTASVSLNFRRYALAVGTGILHLVSLCRRARCRDACMVGQL